jgi:hypothetical protein
VKELQVLFTFLQEQAPGQPMVRRFRLLQAPLAYKASQATCGWKVVVLKWSVAT